MTIDERIQALTMNLELLSHDHEAQRQRVDKLLAAAEALARIAESHERRLTDLEQGEST
jgi:hypothetical protein